LASRQITMRGADGWQSLNERPPRNRATSSCGKSRQNQLRHELRRHRSCDAQALRRISPRGRNAGARDRAQTSSQAGVCVAARRGQCKIEFYSSTYKCIIAMQLRNGLEGVLR
ncbi:MAG: hypothetical protein L0Y50_01645, partial [Beijerinckiaceae bacterium]|nr:hypothetical protein [Beijerinckiaceae bacterium]